MLELMTWQEIVDQLLVEGGFKMVVMFDLQGQIIAGTEGAMIETADALGVFKTMDINNNTICGMFISGSKFSCLTLDPNSMVGSSGDDVFVAHRNSNMLISAVSVIKDHYSCLGFIKNFMTRLTPQDDKTQTLV